MVEEEEVTEDSKNTVCLVESMQCYYIYHFVCCLDCCSSHVSGGFREQCFSL